jgi:S-adenosylmethionine:tRNA ribosyltransferase-isomerase
VPEGACFEIDAQDGAGVSGAGEAVAVAGTEQLPKLYGQIVGRTAWGGRVVRFQSDGDVAAAIEARGAVPLPPYIRAPLAQTERYQTIYASAKGSVAAPTAGLHFTARLIERLRGMGVEFAYVTLHIGLDTFRPVQVDDLASHEMHAEFAELSEPTATLLTAAKRAGRRLVAVGTTAVRVLESAASDGGEIRAYRGWTKLFIYPGYRFKAVDALITNFHLPRSTLLMLVSAFCGRTLTLDVYAEAARRSYRFYSFGDAMLAL